MGKIVISILFLFALLVNTFDSEDTKNDGSEKGESDDPKVEEMIREQLKGHMDAFVSGMKDGMEEIKKEAEEDVAKGGESGGLAQLMDPAKVAHFIRDMLPDRIKVLVPEHWLNMVLKVLFWEGAAILEVYGAADKIGTLDELWQKMEGKTPKLAELIGAIWKVIRDRWDTLNGKLSPESKQYLEKVYSSGWAWFFREAIGPCLRLSDGAKNNLASSLANSFPALHTILSKVVANKALMEWIREEQKRMDRKKEEEEEEKKNKGGGEDDMMAQLRAMLEKMNFDDMMGGMGEEEEGGMEEEEEEKEGKQESKDEEEEKEKGEKGSEKEERKVEEDEVEGEEEGGEENKDEDEHGQCSIDSATGEGKCAAGGGGDGMAEEKDEL